MALSHRIPNITDHDILLLRVFDAVVKAGSFTAAEVCLNKSKSAISVHIASLEARLGKTLCRRGRSGFSLTREGEQIYEICKDLFADLDRFRDRVGRVTSMLEGTVTIAVDDGLVCRQELIAKALRNFKRACPNVFIVLYTASPERVLQMLLDTNADIGICSMPKEIPGTKTHRLFEEELSLYCSEAHPLFDLPDEQITDEVLRACDYVDLGSYQNSAIEAQVGGLNAAGRSGQVAARAILILTGEMIGLLPDEMAQEWVKRGKMRKIVAGGLVVKQDCYTVVREDVAASEVCSRLLSALKWSISEVA